MKSPKPDQAVISSHVEGLGAKWKESRNPVYVWIAIRVCIDYVAPIPPWALDYLAQCGKGILQARFDPQASRDVREVLPGIFGFTKRRGQQSHFAMAREEWAEYPEAARSRPASARMFVRPASWQLQVHSRLRGKGGAMAQPPVDAQTVSDTGLEIFEAIATLEYTGRRASKPAIVAATRRDQDVVGEALDVMTSHGLLAVTEEDGERAYVPARRDWSTQPDQAAGHPMA